MFQSIRRRMGRKATGATDVRLEQMSTEELFEKSHDIAEVAAPPKMIAAEKAYIDKYRRNTSRPAGDPLLGLALSGGGIRSASIALGVMQALAAKEKLQKFDYLSTVSGGGYVGSSLTWFTSRPWTIQDKKDVQFGTGSGTGPVPVFPYGTRGPVMPPSYPPSVAERLLRYLGHHANYLEPTKGLSVLHLTKGINILAAVAVVLRGILVNLFIWLTLLTFAFLVAILFVRPGWKLAPDSPPLPGVFCLALELSALMLFMFFLISVLYSLVTGASRLVSLEMPRFLSYLGDYTFRQGIDRVVPIFLIGAGVLLLIGLVPVVDHLLNQSVKSAGLWSIVGGIASGLWTFWQSRQDRRAPSFAASLIAPVGAFLILYGTALFSYQAAHAVANGSANVAWLGSLVGWAPESLVANAKASTSEYWPQADPKVVVALFFLACLAAFVGWFANLNYTSIHRYYRDRLMESFLPNPDRAVANLPGPAVECDKTGLADVCKDDVACGPYHLINCNVMLNDSDSRVWNLRGGDSFVLAPRYCGSSATGWIKTDRWLKDPLSLATAMAVSGAAANPGTGTGGVGPMRNQLVSVLMSMLNLRLGCWLPNPMHGAMQAIAPNHFIPGLTELLGLGRKEDSRHLQLSDGGHFDNLGLYELIRRKVRLIIVSDGTADPGFAFGDLLTLLPRLREDFGVTIKFDRPPPSRDSAPAPASAPLDFTIPHLDPVAMPRYPAGVPLARCGYAVADITYADKTRGTLIYLKAAVIETMDLELLGYKGKTPDFPNESTLDQFYSEEKFEVHRAVGFFLTDQMLSEIQTHSAGRPNLAVL